MFVQHVLTPGSSLILLSDIFNPGGRVAPNARGGAYRDHRFQGKFLFPEAFWSRYGGKLQDWCKTRLWFAAYSTNGLLLKLDCQVVKIPQSLNDLSLFNQPGELHNPVHLPGIHQSVTACLGCVTK
jgi:hypothetical protein